MSGEAQLMLVIAGMHLLGLACAVLLIVPALRNGNPPPPTDGFGPDDGWGRGGDQPPPPRAPFGGLPLPDAEPARVRLRDHRRLGELLPSRERRPAREPDREPARIG